jgi:hypothetical protein
MIECPNHQGAFDCNPFCQVCEGLQAYDPSEMMKCVVPECKERIEKDIWVEELGFCVEDCHAYYNDKLDYVTLERIEN